MKKKLLLATLFLSSFYVNAQYSCQAPVVITESGTITVPKITGANNLSCYSDTEDSSGNPMAANWYSYTAESTTDIIVTADGTTATSLQILTGTCDALECYDVADETIIFTAEEGTTYFIIWDSYYSNTSFKFDFTISTCSSPSFVNDPTNVTVSSATLSWDAAAGNPSQYEVEYGAIGFNLGEGTSKKVSTTSAYLIGLTPSANYEYYIRSVCGDVDNSEWVGPYTLTLLKKPPYNSGFDSENELAGWGVQGDFYGTFGIDSDPDNAHSPDLYFYFDNSTTEAVDNWLYTPAFSLTAGQVISLSFYGYTNSLEKNRSVRITIGKEQDMDSQTTTIYNNPTLNSDTLAEYTKFTTPNYTVPTTGTYVFGFNDYSGISASVSTMLIDSFSVNLGGGLSVSDFISNKFDVLPNPTNGLITLSNSDNIKVNSISITDLNGRIVKRGDYNNISNININLSDLASGVYMMNIVSDKGTATKKVIKN